MKIKKVAWMIVCAVLFLSGCQKVDDKKALESSEDLAEIQSDIIGEFQSLHELENEFQETFEKSLNAKKDLSNLADQKDPVYDNINQRHQIMKNINETAQKSQESIDILKKYEGKASDATQAVINHFEFLMEQVAKLQKQYDKHLETQGNYLVGLSKEDATHEDLTKGLEKINKEYSKDQELIKEIDTLLPSLNRDLESLLSQINQIVNKEDK